jgi:hypothetical protein
LLLLLLLLCHRVMSFNVRMDTEADGDNRWDNRKEVVASIIRNQRPLAFGLQVGVSKHSSRLWLSVAATLPALFDSEQYWCAACWVHCWQAQ